MFTSANVDHKRMDYDPEAIYIGSSQIDNFENPTNKPLIPVVITSQETHLTHEDYPKFFS